MIESENAIVCIRYHLMGGLIYMMEVKKIYLHIDVTILAAQMVIMTS